MCFQTKAEADDWVGAFYRRGQNRIRYELGVVSIREAAGIDEQRHGPHVTIFCDEPESDVSQAVLWE
jgi:hypothetical protein